MRRTMDWPARYGMDHPTWRGPSAFHYKSADEARAAIEEVYGEDSGHVVVRMARVTKAPEIGAVRRQAVG